MKGVIIPNPKNADMIIRDIVICQNFSAYSYKFSKLRQIEMTCKINDQFFIKIS